MLRTAALVVLLALTGCSSAASSSGDPPSSSAPVSTEPAMLGACRPLTPADIEKSSNDTGTVACSAQHTAQTFAVGSFPASVAGHGMSSPQLGSYVLDQCDHTFERFLGGNDSLVLRSTLTWAWFRPSSDAWDAGAHTWRCDVVGGGERSSTFLTLPRSAKGLLLGRPDDKWMVCVEGPTVTGSVKIPCSEKHSWRAVTTIVLGARQDAYRGDRLSEVRARDSCSDSVGAWLDYPVDYDFGYTWFHAAEWKTGNRRSVCWAKTPQ